MATKILLYVQLTTDAEVLVLVRSYIGLVELSDIEIHAYLIN